MPYRAPVRDIAFSLTAVAGIEDVAATGGFPDYDADVMGAVLEAAGVAARARVLVAAIRATLRLRGFRNARRGRALALAAMAAVRRPWLPAPLGQAAVPPPPPRAAPRPSPPPRCQGRSPRATGRGR